MIKVLKMTIEEKLEKAIEFIKSIEKMNKNNYDTFDISDIENEAACECENCGDNVDVKFYWPGHISLNTKYIDYRVIDDLKDKAWHILVDLEN